MATTGQSPSACTGVHLQGDDGEGDAYCGFTGTGSSDDGRERQITTDIPSIYVRQVLELQETGETQKGLHPIVAESYFTKWGTQAEGFRADSTSVLSISFRL
ncbi:hypothetical protein [Streptomyces sp. CB01201]|uniref:hypothetical protein n=1 Tax=Streptomyces sp. CB01201 TaxID=2020324 RepID=UPI001F281331|nr:hypothetical protein [Streptomyces sp. CB01201]